MFVFTLLAGTGSHPHSPSFSLKIWYKEGKPLSKYFLFSAHGLVHSFVAGWGTFELVGDVDDLFKEVTLTKYNLSILEREARGSP